MLIYLDFSNFGCVIDGWYTCQFVWSVIHSSCNSLDIIAPRGIKQRKKAWRAKTFRVTSFPIESKILTIYARFVNFASNSLYVLDIWFFILWILIIFILLHKNYYYYYLYIYNWILWSSHNFPRQHNIKIKLLFYLNKIIFV